MQEWERRVCAIFYAVRRHNPFYRQRPTPNSLEFREDSADSGAGSPGRWARPAYRITPIVILLLSEAAKRMGESETPNAGRARPVVVLGGQRWAVCLDVAKMWPRVYKNPISPPCVNKNVMARTLSSRFRSLGSPRRHYVYAWYDKGALFYIGTGANSRAIIPHFVGKRLSQAEVRRRESKEHFRCEILCDDMGKIEAVAIETHLIKTLRPECNRQAPKRRRSPNAEWRRGLF